MASDAAEHAAEGERHSAWMTRFTERELEILRLMADGATNPEIAAKLFISRYTVAQHVASMLHRSGCRTRAHLIYRAVIASVIDLRPATSTGA